MLKKHLPCRRSRVRVPSAAPRKALHCGAFHKRSGFSWPGPSIRVGLLIETASYRDGLALGLRIASTVAVVGKLPDWREAAPLLHEPPPDVVLLDVRGTERIAAIRCIGATLPYARVVALASSTRADDVVPLAQAGVAGYVTPS